MKTNYFKLFFLFSLFQLPQAMAQNELKIEVDTSQKGEECKETDLINKINRIAISTSENKNPTKNPYNVPSHFMLAADNKAIEKIIASIDKKREEISNDINITKSSITRLNTLIKLKKESQQSTGAEETQVNELTKKLKSLNQKTTIFEEQKSKLLDVRHNKISFNSSPFGVATEALSIVAIVGYEGYKLFPKLLPINDAERQSTSHSKNKTLKRVAKCGAIVLLATSLYNRSNSPISLDEDNAKMYSSLPLAGLTDIKFIRMPLDKFWAKIKDDKDRLNAHNLAEDHINELENITNELTDKIEAKH